MRISTSTLHTIGYQAISKNQTDLYRLQTQFSSNKRINSAADDPSGAVQASLLTSAKATNTQYARNQTNATNRLQFTESVIGDMGDVITSMGVLVTQAANGSLSNADRTGLAASMQGKLEELLHLANSKDETGRYLFSGFNDTVAPFDESGSGLTYYGDDGIKALPISSTMTMPLNVSGEELLLEVQSGNGIIATSATAANAGSGLIDGGRVLDATAYNGDDFQVVFANGGSGLEYSVINTTTSETVLSAQPYTSGQAIEIPLTATGTPVLALTVSGQPAAGDTLQIGASTPVNAFDSMREAIDALKANAAGTMTDVQLTDVLRRAGADLNQALDQVSLVRGQFGNALAELDRQTDLNTRRDTDIQTRLSNVVDLDIAKAATELTQAQLAYEASQKVYSSLGKQSLFDYL